MPSTYWRHISHVAAEYRRINMHLLIMPNYATLNKLTTFLALSTPLIQMHPSLALVEVLCVNISSQEEIIKIKETICCRKNSSETSLVIPLTNRHKKLRQNAITFAEVSITKETYGMTSFHTSSIY